MSKYKRLDVCPKTFSITYHNEAIDDAQLYVYEYEYPANNSTKYSYTLYAQGNILGIRKDVYLGYEDINNIFEGKLSEAISNQGGNFQLDCNDDQCSGHFSFNGTDNTGAPIRFSLNTCTQDRLITFSYKNTPIFKINQTYEKHETYQTFYMWSIDNFEGMNNLAFFEDSTSLPTSFTGSQTNKINLYMDSISNTQSTALFYFCNTPYTLIEYTKVSDLINSGKLKHLQGHDYLNTDSNKYNGLYLHKISNVNTYENYTFSTKTASLSMKIWLYKSRTNDNSNTLYKSNDYILFGNTDNVNHVGVYKYILNDN